MHAMFELNLIRDRNIRWRRRRVLFGFIGGYALLFGLTAVVLSSLAAGRWAQVRTRERQLAAVAAHIAEVGAKAGGRAREPSLNELGERLEAAARVLAGRLLWSQKLQAVSAAVPEGAWLTEIAVEKQKVKAEAKKAEGDAEASKPKDKGKEKDIVLRTLVVRGAASPGATTAAELVSGLAERLKKDPRFMDGLAGIDSIVIRPSPNPKENEVLTFELRCPFAKEQSDG